MSNYSRVKKYEDLRNQIENNDDSIKTSSSVNNLKTKLNAIDSNFFDANIEVRVDSEGTRTKPVENNIVNDTLFKETKVEEVVVDDKELSNTAQLEKFNNETLDDYIKEAKFYGINRGERSHEDTQVNILSQIRPASTLKRSKYTEELEIEHEYTQPININVHHEEVVEEEIKSDFIKPIEVESTPLEVETTTELQPYNNIEESELTNISEEINNLYSNNSITQNENTNYEVVQDDKVGKRIVEETMQLRVQLSEYEEEMSGLNNNISRNNRILNIILFILIIALVAIIGATVYYIVTNGGF